MADEENKNDEKLKIVLDYFKECNLNPPIEVVNAISDVFAENDRIDSVDFFFKDGIDDLETELTLTNDLELNLDGSFEGICNDVFTYYGAIKISLSEFVKLFKGDELIKPDITFVDNHLTKSKLENPENYLVILVETTKYKSKEDVNISDILRIYCPITSEEAGE